MPSSLAVIHSSALGYSPRPPVSVFGTGSDPVYGPVIFLRVWLPALSARPKARGTVGSRLSPTSLQPTVPSVGGSVTPRSHPPPSRRLRILDRMSIGCPLRVPLRPRLTLIRLALIRNPWAVGARVLPRVVVTHAYIFFSGRSRTPPGTPSTLSAMLPYHCAHAQSLASVQVLMPAHHPRVTARLVSCYALFK